MSEHYDEKMCEHMEKLYDIMQAWYVTCKVSVDSDDPMFLTCDTCKCFEWFHKFRPEI